MASVLREREGARGLALQCANDVHARAALRHAVVERAKNLPVDVVSGLAVRVLDEFEVTQNPSKVLSVIPNQARHILKYKARRKGALDIVDEVLDDAAPGVLLPKV